MRQDYTLDVQPSHSHDEIDECAREIAEYAGNHDNWYKPIVPADGNCREMEFIPEEFHLLGTYWNCLNQPVDKLGMIIHILSCENYIYRSFTDKVLSC